MTITTTEDAMVKAFTEWEKRYRENPQKFMSEATKLLTQTPKNYGESAAPYFVKLLMELK